MIEAVPHRLQYAVAVLCPEIERRVQVNDRPRTEREHWRELSCCLLSSQVPYGLASAAADAIDDADLLTCARADQVALEAVLSSPLQVAGRTRRYRFPVARAAQLASTHRAVHAAARGLSALLDSFADAQQARGWFIEYAAGFGPKQASMFLRNAGYSYELAVLDRHVLNYMTVLGMQDGGSHSMSSLARYHHCEAKLVRHASELGFRVGLLDWAVWIVMRAASSIAREAVRA